MTYLRGIDISHWQRTTPDLAGLAFGFARATYGASRDATYAMHSANFRRAGLVVGAYCFGIGNVDPVTQAAAFLDVARDADLYVLDLESNGKSGPSMTNAQARTFIEHVEAAGKLCGLYHSKSGFPSLGESWQYVAKWGTVPPPTGWEFWQYRGDPLDLDYWFGTKAQLLALAGATPAAASGRRIHVPKGIGVEYSIGPAGITEARHFRTGGFSAACSATQTVHTAPGWTIDGHPASHASTAQVVHLQSGSRGPIPGVRNGWWISIHHPRTTTIEEP